MQPQMDRKNEKILSDQLTVALEEAAFNSKRIEELEANIRIKVCFIFLI